MYVQIADDIARQIEDGNLKPGEKLPSTAALCAKYDVSETVIRFVMVRLKTLGLVDGQPGRGVFVVDRTS